MGFKRKFKDGDAVRVIKPNDKYRYKEIGEVITYYSDYYGKGTYSVKFRENEFVSYRSNELELVESNISCNISSNKLSISDLKPGMKIRIRPDLKEGSNKQVYIVPAMINLAGTIQIIEDIGLNNIYLKNQKFVWTIDCFSEIVEEPEEEIKTSEKVELPLKEGQVVTLLDGKNYEVVKAKTEKGSGCIYCSLLSQKNCNACLINNKSSCSQVLSYGYYFKLVEDNKKENKSSSKSLTISDFKVEKGNADESCDSLNSIEKSSIKEIGIITKVNFTLTDFKSEELEHSKFTVL